jgi:HEAT repeat protein
VGAMGSLSDLPVLDPRVVPALIEVIGNDPEKDVRSSACQALGRFGSRARVAAPLLKQLVADEEKTSWGSGTAHQALIQVAPGDAELIGWILGEPESPPEGGKLKGFSYSVGAFLERLLKEELTSEGSAAPGEPGKAARRAAELPSGLTGPIALYLRPALKGRPSQERALAARLLIRLGEPGESIVQALEEELRGWERWTPLGLPYPPPRFLGRREAARCASEMGLEARALVPHLEACFELGDPLLDVLAAEALWRVAGRRRIDVLLQALEDPLSPDERGSPWSVPAPTEESLEALRVLGDMGPAALEALPAIERFFDDEHPAPLRQAARDAAARIR